jgi:hypothetical protein
MDAIQVRIWSPPGSSTTTISGMMYGEIGTGVGVSVGAGVDVGFGVGVSVHSTAVAVLATEVASAVRSGDAPQAVINTQTRNSTAYFIVVSVLLNQSHAWMDLNLKRF